MNKKKRIVGYLSDEDYDLFESAKQSYQLGESELINEIVHSWLFSNKLQLKKRGAKNV